MDNPLFSSDSVYYGAPHWGWAVGCGQEKLYLWSDSIL